jgi:hypothetical protein
MGSLFVRDGFRVARAAWASSQREDLHARPESLDGDHLVEDERLRDLGEL